jgi:long-subunit acyl-CoA synthetase (AMP-forming)
MQLLAHSELVNQYNVSSLKHLSCGAAPLSRELQNAVTDRLKLPDIRQGYGLTESTLAVLMVPNGRNKPGTSGMVVPGMEAKVKNNY